MSRTINNLIQQHILDPANCHCTIRVLTSPTTAISYDLKKWNKGIKEIVAYIRWDSTEDGCYKIKINMAVAHPVISDIINPVETTEEIDVKVTALFVQMDAANT